MKPLMSVLVPAALALPGLALAQATGQQPAPGAGMPSQPAELEIQQSQTFGSYLTDGQGRALYMFTADSTGSSSCYDACANAWPPFLTQGQPKAAQGADEQKIGTIQRRDGAMQVTYNGMPLYYFARDQGSGSVTGQDVHGFGGEWYLVSPEGEKVEKKKGG